MTHDGLLELSDLARGLRHFARRTPEVLRMIKALARAKPDTRQSIGTVLADSARRHPGRLAIRSDDGDLTFAALDARVNRTANTLARRGVRAGDAVAIMMANRPELLVAVAAVSRLGAVAAMINTQQRHRALVHSFSCVDARHVVVGGELHDAFEAVAAEVDLAPEARTYVRDADDDAPPDGWLDLLDARRAAPATEPVAARAVRLGDPAFYIFTSGTTGLPKASIMSHKRWVGAGHLFGGVCLGLTADDTLYAPLPLYHNHALTLCWSSAMRVGAALAIRRKLSVAAFWEDCRRHDATVVAYIGEIARYLLNAPPSPSDRSHRVRKAVGIGMRPDIWPDFKARFGVDEIYEYYGASELNMGFFNALNLDKTVGFCPFPWALVAWDAERGEPARGADGHLRRIGRGETGLLVTEVTERFAFEGYTDEEATRKKLLRDVFKPGDVYIHTGDLMRHIGLGHLQFVDRVGDTFRWKSENVATSEVEQVVCAAPSVAECTVYGVEVPGCAGRAGMMALVPADGVDAIDLDDVLARLRRDLPKYAWPIFARTTGALETTGTFKHRKVDLRREGFDPAAIADPMHVLLPGRDTYATLTGDTHAALAAGEIAL